MRYLPSARGDRSAGPKVSHPSTSRHVEHVLTARNIPFYFEPNLRIDDIRDADGNQVRLTAHRAPKEMVARFAEQMRAGAVFPAIVVNESLEMVDGNTRRLASHKNGRKTLAAYVCWDSPVFRLARFLLNSTKPTVCR